MEKVLMLGRRDYDEWNFNQEISKYVIKGDLYKTGSLVKYLRHIPGIAYFVLGDKSWIKQYENLIVYDSELTKEALDQIVKLRKGKRTILYFRNSLNGRYEKWNLNKLKEKNNLEIWSYLKKECDEYGMKYNKHTMNRENILKYSVPNAELKYDFFFCGLNRGRGREEILNNLADEFEKLNLTYYYFVSGAPNLRNNHCEYKGENVFTDIGYANEIRLMCESRAELDIVSKLNVTLNARPITAMWLKKKLVTNYTNIKNYDLYNPKNIFILGEDDMSKLKEFLETPYEEIDEKISDSYDINQWIKRFFE